MRGVVINVRLQILTVRCRGFAAFGVCTVCYVVLHCRTCSFYRVARRDQRNVVLSALAAAGVNYQLSLTD